MKKSFFIIFLLFSAISLQAQVYTPEFSMLFATPEEEINNRTPTSGVGIFEGNVTNVPDSTLVNFWVPMDGDYCGEHVATIIGGKFRFEKNIRNDVKYCITLTDKNGKWLSDLDYEYYLQPDLELFFYGIPNGTTRISGNRVMCGFWRVENDDPLAMEANEYDEYKRHFIPSYMNEDDKKNRMAKDTVSMWAVRSDEIYEDENDYVDAMYKFMKDKPYSRKYLEEFSKVAYYASYDNNPFRDENLRKARELCLKLPYNQTPIYLALFADDVLNVDDDIEDFKLYDSNGKEHHLTEFNGNGKYKLMEICRKDDSTVMMTRPKSVLDELYKNYSKNLDIVTVNCDYQDVWKSGKYPRDQWNEWNDYNNGLPIIARYTNQFNYVFISPEGKILGFGKHDNLMDKAKQHFAFVK